MKQNGKRTYIRIGILISCAVFTVSAYFVLHTMLAVHKEKQAFERLAALVQTPASGTAARSEDAETEDAVEKETASPYAALKEQNPDFFGWISIDGTTLDYPVMHTPEAPEYYLHRGFDGAYAAGGVPFLSEACFEGCGNYIVYGHHMKNGSMFSPLLFYAEKQYWEAHPYIQFDTMSGQRRYEVLAAFYTQILPEEAQTEGTFCYYAYPDVREPELFAAYVEQVQAAALYDTGVRAEYGDTLLTASTCSYHVKDGRFVVVARSCS